jgi:hypothetical protein
MNHAIPASVLALLLAGCAAPPPRQSPPSTPMTKAQTPAGKTFYVSPAGNDENAGTLAQPWQTVNKAAATAQAGDTVLIREGTYDITEQIRVANSGTPDAPITFKNYPNEVAVIDAFAINVGTSKIGIRFSHDDGAFQIQGVQHIRIEGLHVQRSRGAGITVRDSSHVDIIANDVRETYSSGISVWDTDHDGQDAQYIRVLSNTVTEANTFKMLPKGYTTDNEAPHEAISIAGAAHFEVAYNHVHFVIKEGIDVKEVSRHGTVHHNLIEGAGRQGLYADAWFGDLEDVTFHDNIVRNCSGAGFAVSVEGGHALRNVRFHNNLLHDNAGTGILFGRWGGDGPRSDVKIFNNTIHHNGHGPASSTGYFWITGGIYLYSANLSDIEIRDNIISDNKGFPIAWSDQWLKIDADGEQALQQRNIDIHHNLIYSNEKTKSPIEVGWAPDDFSKATATNGRNATVSDPQFVAPAKGDFRLQPGSPALTAGSGGGPVGTVNSNR